MAEYTQEGIIVVSREIMESLLAQEMLERDDIKDSGDLVKILEDENPAIYEAYSRVVSTFVTIGERTAFTAGLFLCYQLLRKEGRNSPRTPYKV